MTRSTKAPQQEKRGAAVAAATPAKRGPGRPRKLKPKPEPAIVAPVKKQAGPQNTFHPTEQQAKAIKAMAAYGIRHDEICIIFGITKPTLYKYFRESLDAAMTEANAKVAESLFKMAIGGKHVAAAIYWTKARMGWRDVQATQQLDKDGNPITPGTTFVLKMER